MSTSFYFWGVEHSGHLSSNPPGNRQAGIEARLAADGAHSARPCGSSRRDGTGGRLLSGHRSLGLSRGRFAKSAQEAGASSFPEALDAFATPFLQCAADSTREPSGLSFPVGKHSGSALDLAPADLTIRAVFPSFYKRKSTHRDIFLFFPTLKTPLMVCVAMEIESHTEIHAHSIL